MNEIQILDNEEFGDIRTIFINGEPWFLGEDVVRELGHSKINTNVGNEDIIMVQVLDENNHTQQMIAINESEYSKNEIIISFIGALALFVIIVAVSFVISRLFIL